LEQQILDFINEHISWFGIIVMMAIESACIPLPSEIIMPLAGFSLIAQKGLGWEWIFLAGLFGAVGNVIGSAVAYWIGAWGGRSFLRRYGKYFLITEHDLENADRWFERYCDRAAFLSRLLPGVRTFISLPAGIARTPKLRFFIYTFLGAFIWSTALAYGGYLLGNNWENIRNVMRPFDIPIVLALVGLVIVFLGKRIRELRREKTQKD
jgi:membrane protein DedA with SNARE-associated domain